MIRDRQTGEQTGEIRFSVNSDWPFHLAWYPEDIKHYDDDQLDPP
jgi:hypothetical protein